MIKVFGKNKEKTTDAPMGSAEYNKFIRAAYMDTVNEAVILSDDLDESLSRYDEIVITMSKLKSEKEMIEHNIMSLMKENEIAYVKNRKITWKKVQRTSFDAKTLKEEEPEIYNKYSKTSSIRMFKIKQEVLYGYLQICLFILLERRENYGEVQQRGEVAVYFFLTNGNTTQIGVYKILVKEIAFYTGISEKMVEKLMDKLENEYHMIKYNKNTHEIAIVHWAKYNMNKLGGKPIMDCISSELKKVQDVSLLKIILEDVAKEKVRALFLKEIKEREGRENNKDDSLYEKPSEEELRKVRQLYGQGRQ